MSASAYTVVVWGDSIAAGSAELQWPALAERACRLSCHPGATVTVVNAGVGGMPASVAVNQYAERVAPHRPNLVILQFGFNDVRWSGNSGARPISTPEEFTASLTRMIALCRADGAEVVLFGNHRPGIAMLLPSGYTYAETVARYNVLARRVAATTGTICYCLDEELAAPGHDWPDLLSADGVHLSPLGFHAYGRFAASVILRVIQRADALARIAQVTGPLPSIPADLPLDVQVVSEETVGEVVRRKLTYQTEPGQRLPAYLLLPRRVTRPLPGVLCLHQTVGIGKAEPAGLGGSANLHYALELTQQGYVTLAPDFPGFGEVPIPDPPRHGSRLIHGVHNHRRGLDLLQGLPEVDGARLACVGHSLGGHNGAYLAAFDPRVQALVCSCGVTTWPRYAELRGDLKDWATPIYMPRIGTAYGNDPARMPYDLPDVLGAIAPRAVFLSAAEHDDEMHVQGVREAAAVARRLYAWHRAEHRLGTVYPNLVHDFPPAARQEAWRFLTQALAATAPSP
jgi:dienelactone hydrolase/lysophospholipase L1-like esterase